MHLLLVILLLATTLKSADAAGMLETPDGHAKATTRNAQAGFWHDVAVWLYLPDVIRLGSTCSKIGADILDKERLHRNDPETMLFGHKVPHLLKMGIVVNRHGVHFSLDTRRTHLEGYDDPVMLLMTALSRDMPEIQKVLMKYCMQDLYLTPEDIFFERRLAELAETGNLAAQKELLAYRNNDDDAATTANNMRFQQPVRETLDECSREDLKVLADDGDERAQVLMLMGARFKDGAFEILSTEETKSEKEFEQYVRERYGFAGTFLSHSWRKIVGYGEYDFLTEEDRLSDLAKSNSIAASLYAEGSTCGGFGCKANNAVVIEKLAKIGNSRAQILRAEGLAYGEYGFVQDIEALKVLAADDDSALDMLVSVLRNDNRAELSLSARRDHILDGAERFKIPRLEELRAEGLAHGIYGFVQDIEALKVLAANSDPIAQKVLIAYIDGLPKEEQKKEIIEVAPYCPEAQTMWISGLSSGLYSFDDDDDSWQELAGILARFIRTPSVQAMVGRNQRYTHLMKNSHYSVVRGIAFVDPDSLARLWGFFSMHDQLCGLWNNVVTQQSSNAVTQQCQYNAEGPVTND